MIDPMTSKSEWYVISPYNLNHTLRSQEWRRLSPFKEVPDCSTNSPCQHSTPCIKNSMENMHTDARV